MEFEMEYMTNNNTLRNHKLCSDTGYPFPARSRDTVVLLLFAFDDIHQLSSATFRKNLSAHWEPRDCELFQLP